MHTTLFGTDGIRGKAHEYPLDSASILKLGDCIGKLIATDSSYFSKENTAAKPLVIIGGDTRESTAQIAQTLANGLSNSPIEIIYLGTATTPEISWLSKHYQAALGIVISASHNPWQDNGIKCFSPEGLKIDPALEKKIEIALASTEPSPNTDSVELTITKHTLYQEAQVAQFKDRLDLSGMTILVDYANGAACSSNKGVLEALGATVIESNATPTGQNINEQCGALYPAQLATSIIEHKANIGLCYDGDADRMMFVDEAGEVRDGDFVLAILADFYKQENRLPANTVVGTVMSNLGLDIFLKTIDVNLVRTDVGDKYISQAIQEHNYDLGGEQSGHIILQHYSQTGDGLVSALALLEALQSKHDGSLALGSKLMTKCPQVLHNIRVTEKKSFDDIANLADTVRRIEASLGERGRLLLRYSGTENLARIMLEGEDQKEIEAYATDIGKIIQSAIGSN